MVRNQAGRVPGFCAPGGKRLCSFAKAPRLWYDGGMMPPATASPRSVPLVRLLVLLCAPLVLTLVSTLALAQTPTPPVVEEPEEEAVEVPDSTTLFCPWLPVECEVVFGPLEPAEAESEPLPQIITYTVQSGDSVWTIAARFKLDIDTLRWSNPALARNPDRLQIGQVLVILPVRGAYYTVQAGDTLESIARTYGVDPAAIVAYPLNELKEPVTLLEGQKLVIPGGRKDIRLAKPPLSPVSPFAWPLWGEISQGYRAGHRAIDIGGPYDTPVYAARDGRVTFSGFSHVGYGYMVILDHGNGLTSLYGHLKGDYVSVGQRVKRGEMIGRLGSTGNSTGPHLHFEIRKNGANQNPLDYLPAR
ncbi:MAG: M23 family metallopeptidase [Anaerolineae bacterium]|nr:M23 family metallopeptidase [Anaerolineae bacterium]